MHKHTIIDDDFEEKPAMTRSGAAWLVAIVVISSTIVFFAAKYIVKWLLSLS